jgi:tetrahydromethanopterin S-methyltransferase subunit G
MIEAGVSALIGAIAAGAALTNRIHNRISDLDKRVDTFELSVAQDYVSKADLSVMVQRMEDHMVRIENKLDQIVLRN